MIDAETAQIFVLSAILIAVVGGLGYWDKRRQR